MRGAGFVSLPSESPDFTLEVVLVEEEVRWHDAKKGWRRGGLVIEERRLVDVVVGELEGLRSTRRGDYRTIYVIFEEGRIVLIHRGQP